MEKRISFDEFQSVKRVAQACNPIMMKREKTMAKIQALVKEYKDYDTQIKALEAGIVQVIGLRVEQLVQKVMNPTTKYVPTSIVHYDNEKKQYVITLPDEPAAENPEPPTTADGPGSDYDIDIQTVQSEAETPAETEEQDEELPWQE